MGRLGTLLMVAMLLLGVACDSEGSSPRDAPSIELPPGSPEFGQGRALIETSDDSVLLDVEIAQTDEQHAFGLMKRESLPEDAGMVFLFFEEHSGGFWMKDTLIPLSIAFFDVDGRIVKILDMQPCEVDPCKIYDPGVPYRGALEVNQGLLDDRGVTEGDHIEITQSDPTE
jgi:uncharacterized protein